VAGLVAPSLPDSYSGSRTWRATTLPRRRKSSGRRAARTEYKSLAGQAVLPG